MVLSSWQLKTAVIYLLLGTSIALANIGTCDKERCHELRSRAYDSEANLRRSLKDPGNLSLDTRNHRNWIESRIETPLLEDRLEHLDSRQTPSVAGYRSDRRVIQSGPVLKEEELVVSHRRSERQSKERIKDLADSHYPEVHRDRSNHRENRFQSGHQQIRRDRHNEFRRLEENQRRTSFRSSENSLTDSRRFNSYEVDRSESQEYENRQRNSIPSELLRVDRIELRSLGDRLQDRIIGEHREDPEEFRNIERNLDRSIQEREEEISESRRFIDRQDDRMDTRRDLSDNERREERRVERIDYRRVGDGQQDRKPNERREDPVGSRRVEPNRDRSIHNREHVVAESRRFNDHMESYQRNPTDYERREESRLERSESRRLIYRQQDSMKGDRRDDSEESRHIDRNEDRSMPDREQDIPDSRRFIDRQDDRMDTRRDLSDNDRREERRVERIDYRRVGDGQQDRKTSERREDPEGYRHVEANQDRSVENRRQDIPDSQRFIDSQDRRMDRHMDSRHQNPTEREERRLQRTESDGRKDPEGSRHIEESRDRSIESQEQDNVLSRRFLGRQDDRIESRGDPTDYDKREQRRIERVNSRRLTYPQQNRMIGERRENSEESRHFEANRDRSFQEREQDIPSRSRRFIDRQDGRITSSRRNPPDYDRRDERRIERRESVRLGGPQQDRIIGERRENSDQSQRIEGNRDRLTQNREQGISDSRLFIDREDRRMNSRQQNPTDYERREERRVETKAAGSEDRFVNRELKKQEQSFEGRRFDDRGESSQNYRQLDEREGNLIRAERREEHRSYALDYRRHQDYRDDHMRSERKNNRGLDRREDDGFPRSTGSRQHIERFYQEFLSDGHRLHDAWERFIDGSEFQRQKGTRQSRENTDYRLEDRRESMEDRNKQQRNEDRRLWQKSDVTKELSREYFSFSKGQIILITQATLFAGLFLKSVTENNKFAGRLQQKFYDALKITGF